MGKKLRSRSRSGMNIPDHISESSETIFWSKYLNSLMRMRIRESFLTLDPGWKKIQIRDKHPPATLEKVHTNPTRRGGINGYH
jgi:hypothetical protein